MKRSTKIATGIISAVVLVGSLAACGPHRSPEERADRMVEKISDKLELSAPQVANLEQLKTTVLDSRQRMRTEHEQLHQSIDEIISQPTLDQQRILELVREKTATINQEAPEIVAAMANFYDNLDLEQQADLRDKIREHREHRRWHH